MKIVLLFCLLLASAVIGVPFDRSNLLRDSLEQRNYPDALDIDSLFAPKTFEEPSAFDNEDAINSPEDEFATDHVYDTEQHETFKSIESNENYLFDYNTDDSFGEGDERNYNQHILEGDNVLDQEISGYQQGQSENLGEHAQEEIDNRSEPSQETNELLSENNGEQPSTRKEKQTTQGSGHQSLYKNEDLNQPQAHGSQGQQPQQENEGQPPQVNQEQQPPHENAGQPSSHAGQEQQPKHENDGKRPPHVIQGQRPPHGSQGQRPPHENDGQKPPHGSSEQRPPHENHGQRPPHGSQEQRPSHKNDGQRSPHRNQEQQPPHENEGQRPPHGSPFQKQPSVDSHEHGIQEQQSSHGHLVQREHLHSHRIERHQPVHEQRAPQSSQQQISDSSQRSQLGTDNGNAGNNDPTQQYQAGSSENQSTQNEQHAHADEQDLPIPGDDSFESSDGINVFVPKFVNVDLHFNL